MPIPFHCHECDSPTLNVSGVCDACIKRAKNMVSSNNTGEDLKNILPSEKAKKE
jgi:hypothetical protein|tara:strand:+ start:220 stop:381 length:162 start_codon:yes stop_codon:yes gene_type:complete